MFVDLYYYFLIIILLIAPTNLPVRTLTLRKADINTQVPTSSTHDPLTTHLLPRAVLRNKQNSNRPNLLSDNRFMNNSARNNYEQFLSK